MSVLQNIKPLADAESYLQDAVTLAGAVPSGASDPSILQRIGVLGAGTMGRDIAMGFAQTGRQVVMVDLSREALDRAQAHHHKYLDRRVAKGKMDQDSRDQLLGRISYLDDLAALSDADIVVEAVPEVMALKQKVLAAIEAVVSPDTLITSNTSTLDVDEIASALVRPDRFIGTHFFLPAQANPLLEVVPANVTSAKTLATIMALGQALGKHAVIAPNGDGFIGNRLFDRYHQEAMYLVEEGAEPKDIDDALEAWGFSIGPFRTLDMIGNDIPWGVRRQRAERDNPPPQPRIGDVLCEAGLFGQKTGRGWYLYDQETPKGRPYEAVQALTLRTSKELGRARRHIDGDEIVGRCVIALIVEGMAMLDEGRAARGSDIDMVYVTGYGFPAAFGGPMRLGAEIGTTGVLIQAQHFAKISERQDTAWHLVKTLIAHEAVA